MYYEALNPVEAYLQELTRVRSSGAATPETSYYSALRDLLHAVAKSKLSSRKGSSTALATR